MDHLLISIIMPAYNAEKYIEDSIISVKQQSFTNWELIIVDDGSTDNTAKIVKEKFSGDNQIIFLQQENKKQGAARNKGMKIARGEWIAFLDADDIWPDSKLARQVEQIKKTVADVFYTGGYIVDKNLKIESNYLTSFGYFDGTKMYKQLYKHNIIPVLSVLVSRVWVNKVGYHDEAVIIAGCEDWDYWIKLAKKGATFFGMDEKLFYYRRHDTNVSSNGIKMLLAKTLVFINNFEKKHFSHQEVRKIFKPLIVPLFAILIKNKQLSEAAFLLQSFVRIMPKFPYRFYYFLFTKFKEKALLPIRAINKIDTLINANL